MQPLDETAIDDKIVGALETMCFVLADPIDAADAGSLDRHARIAYEKDDETATLELSASDGFLAEVASGLLGVEPDEIDLEEDTGAVIKELANIFCGEVVELVGGADEEIRMGLHEAAPESSEDDAALVRAFDSMGESLRLRLVRTPR